MERKLRERLVGGKFGNVSDAHSRRMRAIRGRSNRTTELRCRALLVSFGVRGWKMHLVAVPGHPDFYFPASKVAVFVDGCFWHGCPRCGHVPRKNRAYWRAKIKRNEERDHSTDKLLSRMGIEVVRIWEHELVESPLECVEKILRAVRREETQVRDELEWHAVERVRRARVEAPLSAILAWVRMIGPDAVLSAQLSDIRAIANAF